MARQETIIKFGRNFQLLVDTFVVDSDFISATPRSLQQEMASRGFYLLFARIWTTHGVAGSTLLPGVRSIIIIVT